MRWRQYFSLAPKKGKVEDAEQEEFFSIWYPFCDNYKNIWKKEQVRIQEEQAKEERDKYKMMKEYVQ